MGYLKIVVPAVLAVAIMSLPASALALDNTSYCKVAQLVCAAGNQLPSGTTIVAATAPDGVTFATSTGTVSCTSDYTAQTTAATVTGGPVTFTITAINWTNCHISGLLAPCTVTSINLPYNGATQTVGLPGNGTDTWSSGGTGSPGELIVCGEEKGAVINCKETVASAQLANTGGTAGTANVKASSISLTGAGSKCPSKATWSATYVLSSPSAYWVEM